MTGLSAFAYGEQLVRVIERSGEPWFVGRDLCAALDMKQPESAFRRLPDDEKDMLNQHTPGGVQEMTIISEPGMYRLVLTSRTEGAERFKKWVVSEVLPSIRKTGRYEMPGRAEEDLAEALPDQVGFDTPEGRLQIAARMEFVRLSLRVHGREAARRAWDIAGLPCLLPERAELEVEETDPTIRDWVRTRLESVVGAREQSSHLYADYCRDCRQQGVGFVSQKIFSQTLSRAGYRSKKSNGVWFVNVRLRPTSQVALAH